MAYELFDSLPDRTLLHTFAQYFAAFCSRPEAASDVISGRFVTPIVRDKCVKSCDPCRNRFREIPPEAVGSGISDGFFAITSDLKEIVLSYPVWMWSRSARMSL